MKIFSLFIYWNSRSIKKHDVKLLEHPNLVVDPLSSLKTLMSPKLSLKNISVSDDSDVVSYQNIIPNKLFDDLTKKKFYDASILLFSNSDFDWMKKNSEMILNTSMNDTETAIDLTALIIYREFSQISHKIISRFGLIAFLLNSMMLLPTLPILKFKLHVSIFPFMFTGPFVFILPYLIFFCWELNITKIRIIDDYFENFIRVRKSFAEKIITEISANTSTLTSVNRAILKIHYIIAESNYSSLVEKVWKLKSNIAYRREKKDFIRDE
jgi:hypothetical protein